MKPEGWIVMCVSIALVVCLAGWCYYKVLTLPPLGPDEKL